MPDNNDYISQVYGVLKEHYSDFTPTQDEFRSKFSLDNTYPDKVYGLLSKDFSDFKTSKEDFIKKLDLKKKTISNPLHPMVHHQRVKCHLPNGKIHLNIRKIQLMMITLKAKLLRK